MAFATGRKARFKDIYIKIIKLGLPILVGQLGMIAVGFADNIMVGHYSTQALASAAFVNNVFNIVILCCLGFTLGLTPIVGALYARGRKLRAGAVTRMAMRVNVTVTLVLMAVMTVVYFCLDYLGQPPHLLPVIRPYFLIYLAGMLPISVFNVLAQWSYGVDNTFTPMMIILVSNALNVLGNWLLIYGVAGMPEMGLTGAGISTFIARIFTAVAMVIYFVRSRRAAIYRRGWKILPDMSKRVRRVMMRKTFVTAYPVALQMTFETGSFSIAAIMAGLIGEVELAAFQIILITGTLGFCIYYSAGASVAVLVSHRAGHGDREGMRRVAWSGYHVLFALCMISSLIFVVWGRNLMGLFSEDPRVTATAFSLLLPLVLYQVCDATQINFANALRGTSKVLPMLWISFVSYIVVGLPATWLFAFPMGMGIYGLILSFSVSLFLAAILYLYFFLRATRKKAPEKEAKIEEKLVRV